MSRYRLGADFERAVRLDLEASGYFVIRSAGSKTSVDLAAWKPWYGHGTLPNDMVFVQCKVDGRISRGSLEEFRSLAASCGAKALIAYWHKPGHAARTVAYRQVFLQLDGTTQARADWTPDWALEATSD